MKHGSLTAIALCFLLVAQGVLAQQHNFGLGVIMGEPTGMSAKVWMSDVNAFDVGLGWSMGGDQIGLNRYYYGGNRIHVHADILWHAFDAINSEEPYPLFYGIGARINSGNSTTASLAIRLVGGIMWLPREVPIDIFLELVPLFQALPSGGFGIDAAVGARYFF